eukprot:GHVH01001670.1.p1 GENE.GHVH01001670.1~~GHVH01001670.1.p1  ORF type:complete len:313 (+),score=53.03 GHVH01001670.1:433-1371(+)
MRYIEIDFGEVTSRKKQIIESTTLLKNKLSYNDVSPSLSQDGVVIGSDNYSLLAFDLTNGDKSPLATMLDAVHFDRTTPTLVLSECCLIYLEPDESDAVLGWFADYLQGVAQVVLYEQIHPTDPFGRQMCDHLKRMGCQLKSVHKYPDPSSIVARLKSLGWDETELDCARDMNYIYDKCLDMSDILRIQKIELFDELEEWRLIQAHYAITVGTKSSSSTPADFIDNLKSVFKPLDIVPPAFTSEEAKSQPEISLRKLAAERCASEERIVKDKFYQMSAIVQEAVLMNHPVNPSILDLERKKPCSQEPWLIRR